MRTYPEHLESMCIDIMQEFNVNWKSSRIEDQKPSIRIEFFEKLLPRNIFWYWNEKYYTYTKFGDLLERLFNYMWTAYTENWNVAKDKYRDFSWDDIRFLNKNMYEPYDRSFSV